MTVKGIIFDFNGTLFLDSEIHKNTWFAVARILRKKPLSEQEYHEKGHGQTNANFIRYLTGTRLNLKSLAEIIEQKESLYRKLCLENKKDFKLAPGSEVFLNEAMKKNLHITIATGAYEPNVDFYFKHFNLAKWFNRDMVIYDDGLFPGKPEPYPYLRAAEKLGLQPEFCVVFEDSMSGIKAAISAGIGRVVTVDPNLDPVKVSNLGQIYKMVNGFENVEIADILE